MLDRCSHQPQPSLGRDDGAATLPGVAPVRRPRRACARRDRPVRRHALRPRGRRHRDGRRPPAPVAPRRVRGVGSPVAPRRCSSCSRCCAVAYAWPVARVPAPARRDRQRCAPQSAATQARVDALEAQKQRWADPAYVEAQARERLHFVLPGRDGVRRAAAGPPDASRRPCRRRPRRSCRRGTPRCGTACRAPTSPPSTATVTAAADGRAFDDADVAAVGAQLGRAPRGVVDVAHRCPCGLPDVVRTAPRLPDGTPFPTLYYLTCPRATAAIGTLEAAGLMREMTERLDADAELAAAYRHAHEAYLAAPRRARRRARDRRRVAPAACRTGSSACTCSSRTRWPRGRASTRSATRRSPLLPTVVVRPARASRPRRRSREQDRTGRRHRLRHELDPAAGRRRRPGRRDADRPRPAHGDRPARPGRRPDRPARRRRRWSGRSPPCDEYAARIAELGAERVRFVATSATRDAENRADFVAGVRARLGVEPEVISGDEEAALSFAGATRELQRARAGPVPRRRHRRRLDRVRARATAGRSPRARSTSAACG